MTRSLIADAYRAPGHPCQPPRALDLTVPHPVGARWSCPSCRRGWIVQESDTTRGGHRLIGPYRRVWRPAGPVTRMRDVLARIPRRRSPGSGSASSAAWT